MDSVIKYHGGKHYLASRIVDLFPPHTHYVEPYFGSGAVLFASDPTDRSEVVNDIDARLMNFWTVLRDPTLFNSLQRTLQATPFGEPMFRLAVGTRMRDAVTDAADLFTEIRQSLAGRRRDPAPLSRNRTRRGMNEQCSAWLNAINGLPEIHTRLQRVALLCRPAIEVILSQDGPRTLFYCDPPYHPATRADPAVYAHEMTAAQHEALALTLRRISGKAIVSGYRCPDYDKWYADWRRIDFDAPNNAAGGSTKNRVVESVWCNYADVQRSM